ncbi:MAG: MmcQ/YjbR family DNA-binding protein [Pseudomonadota bacterium]
MLTNADVWKVCRALPGSTDQVQWENDRVFKVGGKMFACTGLNKSQPYSFKVETHRFLELTDQPGIRPAPYLARFHWVQVVPGECVLSNQELRALLRGSHALVLSGLSGKKQSEIMNT